MAGHSFRYHDVIIEDNDDGVTKQHIFHSEDTTVLHYDREYGQLRSRNYPDCLVKVHAHQIDNDCTSECRVYYRGEVVSEDT